MYSSDRKSFIYKYCINLFATSRQNCFENKNTFSFKNIVIVYERIRCLYTYYMGFYFKSCSVTSNRYADI